MVVVGEREDTDVVRGLDWGLQLQKHDVVVMVQVGGADLVLRVGNRADYLPHLLSSLCAPQGMLAQVNSVPVLQTVCCSEDPSGVDQDSPTEQPPLN